MTNVYEITFESGISLFVLNDKVDEIRKAISRNGFGRITGIEPKAYESKEAALLAIQGGSIV